MVLTGMLEDYQLAELLSPERMPQDEVDSLIAEATGTAGSTTLPRSSCASIPSKPLHRKTSRRSKTPARPR